MSKVQERGAGEREKWQKEGKDFIYKNNFAFPRTNMIYHLTIFKIVCLQVTLIFLLFLVMIIIQIPIIHHFI